MLLKEGLPTRVAVFAAFTLFPVAQLLVQRFGVPISPHSLIFLYLAILAVAGALREGSIPKPNVPVRIYLLGLLLCFFFMPFVENKISVISSLIRQGDLLLPYFVLLLIGRSIPVAKLALKGYVVGNVVACTYALLLFFSGEVFYSGRLTYSEGYNPTVFGANIAAALILIPLIVPKERSYYTSLLFVGIATLLFVSLILSQSRNALISLFLSGFAIAVLVMVRRFPIRSGKIRGGKAMLRTVAAAATVLMSLAAVTFLFFKFVEVDQRYFSRLFALLEWSDSGAATAGRDEIWQMYLDVAVPLWGFGFDNTESFIALVGLEHFPHNSFILIYMQGGLLLLAIYVLFCVSIVVEAQPKRGMLLPVSVASVYLVCLNLGNDVYQYSYFWVPFAIVMAFVRQINRQDVQGRPSGGRQPIGVSA